MPSSTCASLIPLAGQCPRVAERDGTRGRAAGAGRGDQAWGPAVPGRGARTADDHHAPDGGRPAGVVLCLAGPVGRGLRASLPADARQPRGRQPVPGGTDGEHRPNDAVPPHEGARYPAAVASSARVTPIPSLPPRSSVGCPRTAASVA